MSLEKPIQRSLEKPVKTWMEKLIRKLLTREVITYVRTCVLTTAVNFLAFYLLNDLMRMHDFWVNALAWVVAVVFAFVTNKQFVFESKSWKLKSTLKRGNRFYGRTRSYPASGAGRDVALCGSHPYERKSS